MRRNQSGFTLIEIAIVLVIIGLLLGGVLKGQELINSAKVKNMIGDFRTTSTFIYAYQDKFRALPGDDASAVTHVAGTAATTFGTGALGDGRIGGLWNSVTKTDESYLFWEHVRKAGLASGSTDVAATAPADFLPRNADGGKLGITGQTPVPLWAGTNFVCSSGIQGKLARQIDTTMDDGNTATGTVRVLGDATGGELATAAAAYTVVVADDSTLFTVCVQY